MKLIPALALSLILTLGVFSAPHTSAGTSSPYCTYHATTGHNVHGAFDTFYRSHNGGHNLGNPLTEALWENGRVVQYFERGRLDFYPENPESTRVQVAMLGTLYNITDPPIRSAAIPPPDNPNFLYFPETGHMVSFAIKDYFTANGGVAIFGYPISVLRFESGKFVQYFQRQRLEWDPLAASKEKVTPSAIGQLALEKNHPANLPARARVPTDWCGSPVIGPTPTRPPFVIPTPTGLNFALKLEVRVHFQSPRTPGPQYVTVTAEDQNARRLPNVASYAIVRFANGERYFPLLPTDSSGVSTFGFEMGTQPRNCSITVQVFGYSGALTATGSNTFTCQ